MLTQKEHISVSHLTNFVCRKEENPQLDERYWKLLSDLLSHFVNAKASDRTPTIRVPLILAFSAAFQSFSDASNWENQKALSLYSTIQTCLQLLSQPTFTFAYRPPMDHLFTTFENIISVMDEHINKHGVEANKLLAEFAKMANIITPQLDALMLTSANQRKVCG